MNWLAWAEGNVAGLDVLKVTRRASLDQVLRKVGGRRVHVVEDVLKVMMNWLGCAEENVAGPDEGRRIN